MLDPRNRNREINRAHNERMKDRLVNRFEEVVTELQGYALRTQVPADPHLPASLVAGNGPEKLKDPAVRQYTVRRSLALAEETLKEIGMLDGKKVSQFHLKKLLEQERSLRTLLDALPDRHVG